MGERPCVTSGLLGFGKGFRLLGVTQVIIGGL